MISQYTHTHTHTQTDSPTTPLVLSFRSGLFWEQHPPTRGTIFKSGHRWNKGL